jgi:transketolase
MGLAPIGWTLFTETLRHAPTRPHWPNRDRFVLSNGHASMLLYALLHLTGYDLPVAQLERFRQWGSHTPGHPERGDVPGVEVTTGPLGQGFANAVGLALAERMCAARFNRPGHDVVDHRTWFLCSDGDLMEGISHEAASLAGFLRLERLIGVYDDNHVSLDGPTSLSFAEDVPGRFEAYGWRVLHVAEGNDVDQIRSAYHEAMVPDGRPTLIAAHTHIGYGSPNKHDSSASHGSPLGEEEVALTKDAYGWPRTPPFLIPPEVASWAGACIERGEGLLAEWEERMRAYRAEHPELAAEFDRVCAGELPAGLAEAFPRFSADATGMATRAASGRVLNAVADSMPELVGGAADLASSTNTTLTGHGDVRPGDYAGRNLHFGVREHAMGGVLNGLNAYGGLRAYGATFMTFSDYMKNTIRMASLQGLGTVFVYTHDSIGLGEDGPTHQPVEHLAALRSIPGVVTIRPADANETSAAWRVALERRAAPTVLVLSRQALPTQDGPADVARGAYVLADGDDCALIATGSEVQLAMSARDLLAGEGVAARVVSMPSFELFAAQPFDYRELVLPGALTARVAVEAASPFGWHRWTGDRGRIVALDRFGASAPGPIVLRELGFTPEAVAAAARESMEA